MMKMMFICYEELAMCCFLSCFTRQLRKSEGSFDIDDVLSRDLPEDDSSASTCFLDKLLLTMVRLF